MNAMAGPGVLSQITGNGTLACLSLIGGNMPKHVNPLMRGAVAPFKRT